MKNSLSGLYKQPVTILFVINIHLKQSFKSKIPSKLLFEGERRKSLASGSQSPDWEPAYIKSLI
jgi:hypothetical protein